MQKYLLNIVSLIFIMLLSSCSYLVKKDNDIREAIENEDFILLKKLTSKRQITHLPYYYELSNQNTALHIGAKQNNRQIILFLLKLKEPINAQNINGNTALLEASSLDNCEALETLAVKGANLNIKNNQGHTALIISILQKNEECVEILLMNKANHQIKDNNKFSPLELSRALKAYNIEKLLLQYGA